MVIERRQGFGSLTRPIDVGQALAPQTEEPTSSQLFRASEFLYLPPQRDPIDFAILMREFGDPQPPLPFDLEKTLRVAQTTALYPTLPAVQLAEATHLSLEEIRNGYEWERRSRLMQAVMTSHYYPGYLLVRYGQSFLRDLVKNPDYLERVEQRLPVAPRRLEIHATNASCNYRCEMCLWHVKNQGDYHEKPLHLARLTTDEWNMVLSQAKSMGTEVVIFSGGGEPLLRSNSGEIIDHANQIGLTTMIYTNGSQLESLPFDSQLYQAILGSNWLRVSLHATTDERYGALVHLPPDSLPFSKVVRGIQRLKNDAEKRSLPLKIGIGFVIQSLNYDQVQEVAKLGFALGLDFLNLRVDCIDITDKLTPEQETQLYDQLRRIRSAFENGTYGKMEVDFADSLIGPMNGWSGQPHVEVAPECRVHLYRSAIDPYGRVAVCDLTAEPHFASDTYTLGRITGEKAYQAILTEAANRQFNAKGCQSCMPGQQAINALWHKVLEDRKVGINPNQQPFFFRSLERVKEL